MAFRPIAVDHRCLLASQFDFQADKDANPNEKNNKEVDRLLFSTAANVGESMHPNRTSI